eukprot:6484277-Amphidinium_carterae.3
MGPFCQAKEILEALGQTRSPTYMVSLTWRADNLPPHFYDQTPIARLLDVQTVPDCISASLTMVDAFSAANLAKALCCNLASTYHGRAHG